MAVIPSSPEVLARLNLLLMPLQRLWAVLGDWQGEASQEDNSDRDTEGGKKGGRRRGYMRFD